MPQSNENQVTEREAFGLHETPEGGSVELASSGKKPLKKVAVKTKKTKLQIRFPEPNSKAK